MKHTNNANIYKVIERFHHFLPHGSNFYDAINDFDFEYKEKTEILRYLTEESIIEPWGDHGKHILTRIGESIVDTHGSLDSYLSYRLGLEKKEADITETKNLKLIYDAKLSKWQSKVFWPLFIIACLGGFQAIYSIADLIVGESLEQKVERILDIKIQERQQKEKTSTFQTDIDTVASHNSH